MEENKKIEINDTENIPVEIIDNRREIDDLSDAELKELEKELEQYDKDMWRHLDCLQKYKHIGEEIPKDVPFTEYFGYIIRNFRNPKPRKEWTVRDYKVDAAKEARKMAAFTIKNHGYKEPLTDKNVLWSESETAQISMFLTQWRKLGNVLNSSI